MTNKQLKVCKYISKHESLNDIIKKFKFSDYMEFQVFIGYQNIEFSDCNMDINTTIKLNDDVIEILESSKSKSIDIWFNRLIAFAAFVISIIALIKQ